jgi:membrane protease YdiL (CAAX protease family)
MHGDILENPEIRADSRIRDLFELCVFLLLIVPSMIFSFFTLGSENFDFRVSALSIILRDIALTSLVVYFLWRNGEPLALIGWRPNGLKIEALLGAGLFVPVTIGIILMESALQHFGLSSKMSHLPQFLSPKGQSDVLIAFVLVTVVAITEETIFRGYLILRLNSLFHSKAASVIITSGVFSLGHGYEGLASVGTIGVLGVVLALIYVWRKSLIAPMVIHFLIDFVPLVLIPLSKIR